MIDISIGLLIVLSILSLPTALTILYGIVSLFGCLYDLMRKKRHKNNNCPYEIENNGE